MTTKEKEKWASKQLTKKQAIAFANSDVWQGWTAEQIVQLVLFQKKLCIPFDKFHEAITEVLGRPVYSHEFACRDLIVEEYLGVRPIPTLQEILDLIPADKRIIIGLNN